MGIREVGDLTFLVWLEGMGIEKGRGRGVKRGKSHRSIPMGGLVI
jgi:hypothetical protein